MEYPGRPARHGQARTRTRSTVQRRSAPTRRVRSLRSGQERGVPLRQDAGLRRNVADRRAGPGTERPTRIARCVRPAARLRGATERAASDRVSTSCAGDRHRCRRGPVAEDLRCGQLQVRLHRTPRTRRRPAPAKMTPQGGVEPHHRMARGQEPGGEALSEGRRLPQGFVPARNPLTSENEGDTHNDDDQAHDDMHLFIVARRPRRGWPDEAQAQ